MSRSGYGDDMDQWDLIRWRGAVASAIRGKRGQALLKELEVALLALPKKRLIAHEFANAESGQVCALGAVALKRRLDKGQDRMTALAEIEQEFPEGSEAECVACAFDISDALAKEITYINDEPHGFDEIGPEKRYKEVLAWVRDQLAVKSPNGKKE